LTQPPIKECDHLVPP